MIVAPMLARRAWIRARSFFRACPAFCLFASLALACAKPAPVRVVPGADERLAADEGFVIIAVDTDVGIADLRLDKFSIAGNLQPDRHLWIVKMKAGRYRWRSVRLVAHRAGEKEIRPEAINVLNEREFDFEVEPGYVNYPGEIIVRLNVPQYGIEMGVSVRNRNHSAMAIRRLEKTDAALLGKHPLRYAGMSGDGFLEFYSKSRDRVAASRPRVGIEPKEKR